MSTTAAARPKIRPENELFMVLTWPSMSTWAVFGASLGGFVQNLLHVGRDGAEIASLRGAVNLDERLNVVLRIHSRNGAALEVGESLRALAVLLPAAK